MRDAEIGESLILVNHITINGQTPYAASHAIFILEGAEKTLLCFKRNSEGNASQAFVFTGFDHDNIIVDATLAEGDSIKFDIQKLFQLPQVEKIHAHYALRGCFAAEILPLRHPHD